MAQGSEDSNDGLILMVFILIVLACFGLYKMFFLYAFVWQWFRVAQVGLMAFITPDYLESLLGVDFEGGLNFLLGTTNDQVSGTLVAMYDKIYSRWLMWIPGAALMYAGFKLMGRGDNITTKHSMESLLKQMSGAFPHNKAFIGVNPELTPIDFYPDDPDSYEYSMAMGEREFGECTPPVGLMKAAEKDPSLHKPIWNEVEETFNNELARKAFEAQLGPVYRGYNHLTDDERKITDLFVSKILIKRKVVVPVITNYINQAYANAKNGNTGINLIVDSSAHKALANLLELHVSTALAANSGWRPTAVIARRFVTDRAYGAVLRQIMADDILVKHAFVYTGLMSLLEMAREGGSLPPASLRWLKGRNRPFWYALNCPGKKTSFTECAGTFAHWLLEVECGFAVPHPEVTEAVEGLRIALGFARRDGLSIDDEQFN